MTIRNTATGPIFMPTTSKYGRKVPLDHLYLYLCGSVKKGDADHRQENQYWTPDDEQILRKLLPRTQLSLLNPARSKISRNDYIANFGCDLYLISKSDIILCDARTRKGIGIGAELMYAAYERIPVITICPPGSHYRRDKLKNVFGEELNGWIHPFVAGLSDYIVDDLRSIKPLLKLAVDQGNLQKTVSIAAAVLHFERSYNVTHIQRN